MATVEPSIKMSPRATRLLARLEKLLEHNVDKTYVHEYDTSLDGRQFTVTWIRGRGVDKEHRSAVAWGHDLETALRRAVYLEELLQADEGRGDVPAFPHRP